MGVGLSDLVPKARLTVTIADGASLSGASGEITPAGSGIRGLMLPAAWVAAKVSLQGSIDGSTWFEVVAPGNGGDRFATATLTVTTAGFYVPLDPAMTDGLRYVKVRSGTEAAATNQTGGPLTILIITRPVS